MVKQPEILHTTIARMLNLSSADAGGLGGLGAAMGALEQGGRRSLSGSAGGGLAPRGLHVAEVLAAVEALSKALCGLKVQFRCVFGVCLRCWEGGKN